MVGIGISAGGLEALSSLLATLPGDSGMAFVVVPHLPPDEPSLLVDLLAKETPIPVVVATDGALLERDRIYVLPPNHTVAYAEGRLHLALRVRSAHPTPIDGFLRSLAIGKRSRAVGVILSGTGSDGALGIQAVKAAGGITFAQDPRSARFDGMPLAAVGTGAVDFMLPPEQIGTELGGVAGRLHLAYQPPPATPAPADDEDLRRVFAVLRAAHEVDFTLYRHTTIKRRIARRMVLNRVPTLHEYLGLLKERPLEVEALYADILIKVTHFFRDPETFEALARHVFPALLAARGPDSPIRIWVPGCSTGEEVYSIAIALLEAMGEDQPQVPFQIFATDVSEAALETARAGAYIENIAMDVSAERLRRFFTRSGKLFQIHKSIRAMCVFARQNLTRDPPFSRLDLVSCRNVLIYLQPVLQKRVIPIFHYALKPGGYLVLGTSETIGGLSEIFSVADKTSRIYAKVPAPASLGFELLGREGGARPGSGGGGRRPLLRDREPAARGATVAEAQREADRLALSRYAPPGVLVDDELQIVQFRGHTGHYLEPAPGEASLNLLKMAREALAHELRTAMHRARRTDRPVRTEAVRLRDDGQERSVALEVIPFQSGAEPERWFLVFFHAAGGDSVAAEAPAPARSRRAAEEPRVAKLERELSAARDYLQVTIEEQEATNEELQSANEELLSSNEELQSINEELETAKEELQSTNEELTTLNEELGSRNVELNRLNNDLVNLLASVNIPIVMVSADARIRRFTPQAQRVLNLIPGDVGRPIGDLNPRIDAPDLEQLIAEVIDTVSIRERDVQDREGRWYSMRIRPYRTTDNKIDGAVILLVDIDRIRRGLAGDGAPAEPA